METKPSTKSTTERNNKNIIKFQRVLKQNCGTTKQAIGPQKQQSKKYIHDQQTMKDMIKSLKQQNGQLKQVIKIQQTQLHYFKEQQKQMVINFPSDNDKKKLLQTNFILKRKKEQLEEQCFKIKKSCKYTKIKELQINNQEYLEQIKVLNAQIKSGLSAKMNIVELNAVIQKEYFTALRNKQLQKQVSDKDLKIRQSDKTLRNMKNQMNKKCKQISDLKINIDQIEKQCHQNKNLQDYVHKSQLLTKKKQLLCMSQAVQNLQIKLTQCQNKAQSLQQQNIDNMNREAMKRKQLLVAYQNMKQKCSKLQHLLSINNSIGHMMDNKENIDKVKLDSELINKPRNPMVITAESITDIIDYMVHQLQTNNIDKDSAIDQIINRNQQFKEDDQKNKNYQIESDNTQSVTIRKIMHVITSKPFNIQKYQWKQLFARYCAEDNSQDHPCIRYDANVNYQYVQSVLKKIIPDYSIFSNDDKIVLSTEIQKFLNNYCNTIKHTLNSSISYKLQSNDGSATRKLNPDQLTPSHPKSRNYLCTDIINAIIKQNQLQQFAIEFIKFRVYSIKDQYITIEEFMNNFKRNQQIGKHENQAQFCLFLTQREKEEEQQQKQNVVKNKSYFSKEVQHERVSDSEENKDDNVQDSKE